MAPLPVGQGSKEPARGGVLGVSSATSFFLEFPLQTEGTQKNATPHLRVQGHCTLPLHDDNVLLDWSLWLSQVSWGLQYPKILSLLFRLQQNLMKLWLLEKNKKI
jgi:hypothetical protein